MTGETIAESTLLKFVLRLHQALAPWEKQAIEKLMNYAAMHVDETSLRVNSSNHWIHVHAGADITLKFLHKSRGKKAIEEFNIIPRYTGIIIHDCWQSYLSSGNCGHGLCGLHIVGELTCVIDANGYRWASNMKALLLETCKKVSKRKSSAKKNMPICKSGFEILSLEVRQSYCLFRQKLMAVAR